MTTDRTMADIQREQRLRGMAPSVAVDPVDVGDMTVAEILTAALARMEDFRQAQHGNPAGRDFALAITHAEDARTRFNAGVYRMNGTYAPSDAQRQPLPDTPAEEVTDA